MLMPSGAAHDAQQIAEVARIAMIFVRSKDGRSHSPAEFTSVADATAGIEVLAAALHRLAY
jgi:allantoate deiminase